LAAVDKGTASLYVYFQMLPGISELPEHRTVREIASLIRRHDEELDTVVERIRAWTDLGLVKASGRKSPGTGRKRRYEAAAAVDALILTALTDAGLAAVRTSNFKGVDGQTVMQLGRIGAAAVFDPASAGQKFYLVIAGSPAASIHTTYVAYSGYGQPAAIEIDPSRPLPVLTPEHVKVPPDASWSVVLNLNEIFRRLKGVVTASIEKERGFVKVAFIEGED
jgi:hypothetical protein